MSETDCVAKTIYFVRHGECQANADRLIAGSQNDSPLTPKGLEQADITAEALRGRQIDLIATSPLARARDTAKRIASVIGYTGEVVVEPLLTERDFGAATGQPAIVGFEALDAGRVADAETLEQLADRMCQALEALKALPGQYILVVGHSGAERMLRTIYEGKTSQQFLQTEPLHNGGIREYQI